MDITDIVTIADLSEELGVSYPSAAKLAKDSNSGFKLGRGSRVTYYSRSSVRVLLRSRNLKMLEFLGIESE